jgi:HAD superfamily hydrolase (TIGR01509 family)
MEPVVTLWRPAMKRFEAVIFDLDGVLVISESINVEAMVITMWLHGMPLTEEEIRTIPGRSSIDAIPGFLKSRGIPESEYMAIVDENRARYDSLWDTKVELAPHADIVVQSLRCKSIPLAIGTTNRRSVVEKFINRFGFDSAFSVIVTGRDVARRKPDPEVYVLTQQKIGVPREKILVVEDTAFGVAAAKDASLACAAIPSEFFRDQDFSRADFLMSSLHDLLAIVC